MVSLQLFDKQINKNNNNICKTNQDPIINTINANIDDTMGLGCTPQHVRFAFDLSLQQAIMVIPGTQCNYKEDFNEMDPASKRSIWQYWNDWWDWNNW